MKIYLRDRNQKLCDYWDYYFKSYQDVEISCGDIFELGQDVDAIVSPANSFGFMDGGIDLNYSEEFGWDMSKALREKIGTMRHGELLVGDATSIRIRNYNPDASIEWLISAPTMRVPADVSSTVNAYLAFRAALSEARDKGFKSILCPGLGTAVGKLPYKSAAAQMAQAYRVGTENPRYEHLRNAQYIEYWMISPN